MSNTNKLGQGSAFPAHVAFTPSGEFANPNHYFDGGQGMTERAYHASNALQGLLASEAGENGPCYNARYLDPKGNETWQDKAFDHDQKKVIEHALLLSREQHLAREAVKIADALLAELSK